MSNDQMALRQSHSTEVVGRWFELRGDARLGRCATEGCGGQPTLRLEADGIGSDYCSGCAAKIRALSPVHKDGEPVGSDAAAIEIADAVIAWMVKYDLLDADQEYRDDDIVAVLDELAPDPHPKEAEVTVTEEMVEAAIPYLSGLRIAGETEYRTIVRAALVAALSRKG